MTENQGGVAMVSLLVIMFVAVVHFIGLLPPSPIKEEDWAQSKYQIVSSVVNPRWNMYMGTVLKTVDEDTGATIYVLVSGNEVHGLAVLREPQKK